MNKTNSGSFYIKEFLKNLMRPRNIPIILYLLVDSMFIFIAFMIVGLIIWNGTMNTPEFLLCAGLSIVIYLGSMALSLSPIGEKFLRFKQKCKPITDQAIIDRIYPLFYEVYERAKLNAPALSDKIELYIQETKEANAFAMGKRTVCITTGLLEYSDAHIKAVLAHEFGHLAHRDTELLLVVNIANTFIHLIFVAIWVFLIICQIIFKILSFFACLIDEDFGTVVGAVGNVFFMIVSFIFVRLVEKLWNIIGNLLLMFSSRGAEFSADLFAQNLGYGEGLISFFRTLPDSTRGKRRTLHLILSKLATIGQSHPSTWRRIENLEKNKNVLVFSTVS